MCNLIVALLLYILVEAIANFLFFQRLKKIYGSKQQDHEKIRPWLKGVLERVCLIVGISLGYPQILVAFGALKIGTKINNESLNSEYYLLGNLASILTCFIAVYLLNSYELIRWIARLFGC